MCKKKIKWIWSGYKTKNIFNDLKTAHNKWKKNDEKHLQKIYTKLNLIIMIIETF
jgi:hypothetical protein